MRLRCSTDYEYSRKEVAEALGVSVQVVANIEHEALEKIKAALEERGITL